MPLRMIDLHVDWLLQYAPESTVFDAAEYPGVSGRLAQTEGYLQTTRAAVVSCYRNGPEWRKRPDAWVALDQLVTRIEAEFAGRILIGLDDFDRWEDDKNGLTWALIGVEGFDHLVRGDEDLERVAGLFRRGVRLFQPSYTADGLLAGSSSPGDDRGLTDLGRQFLETLAGFWPGGATDPRPILDLAHLNPSSCGEVLDWFEADPGRLDRVLLAYSHGVVEHEGFSTPRALSVANLARLRALGGFVGISVSPPFLETAEQVKTAIDRVASVPFRGKVAGFEGIGFGTDFLGVDRTIPLLDNAPKLAEWAAKTFDRAGANALLYDNARKLMARSVGASNLI